jgi:hypothetical protein
VDRHGLGLGDAAVVRALIARVVVFVAERALRRATEGVVTEAPLRLRRVVAAVRELLLGTGSRSAAAGVAVCPWREVIAARVPGTTTDASGDGGDPSARGS